MVGWGTAVVGAGPGGPLPLAAEGKAGVALEDAGTPWRVCSISEPGSFGGSRAAGGGCADRGVKGVSDSIFGPFHADGLEGVSGGRCSVSNTSWEESGRPPSGQVGNRSLCHSGAGSAGPAEEGGASVSSEEESGRRTPIGIGGGRSVQNAPQMGHRGSDGPSLPRCPLAQVQLGIRPSGRKDDVFARIAKEFYFTTLPRWGQTAEPRQTAQSVRIHPSGAAFPVELGKGLPAGEEADPVRSKQATS